ncbi:P-loop NTPase fold protein [Kribbella sp. NPDC023855]|uniref:P-loop NTPase fold protein n=1 Tax=Kribbella sp. NPDC023855 TaxID=3154698 RepID=UPI0033E4D408
MDGAPILATGGLRTQVWPARILQDPANAAASGTVPTTLLDARSEWGTWQDIEGTTFLATGDSEGVIRFHNYRTGEVSSYQHQDFPSGDRSWNSWGMWHLYDGQPLLVTGNTEGTVLFLNVDRTSVHQLSLGGPVVWGAWGRLDGHPVLAAGNDEGVIRLWDLVWESAVPRVPRYRSDTGSTTDLLGRRSDAAALADVVTARSARPPLAVGLFGQWGDGKSTFLEMLQEEVTERARAAGPNDPIAHGHVRQVRFNAWHYAEADLWASLVAELFAQLSEDDADPTREQRQRSRLASELVQARGLREQLAAAEDRLAELRRADLGKLSAWAALTPSTRQRLQDVLGQDAEKIYQEAATTSSVGRRTLRALARLPRAISWRGWLAGAVGVAGTATLVLWGPDLARWFAALPAVAGAAVVIGAAVRGWERTQPAREAIGAGWQTIKRIRDEQKQRLETAEAVAAAEVDELRQRIQNLTSAGQLAGVVQERAGAASYRERLGLMTQIRQDFERMAELLRPDEVSQYDVPVHDAAGDELPTIDRIVIYIDDLDRCPPDRVIDVLEAVHLLLAVRLFVVVVAVDPRWLLRSLTSHYRELFEEADDELRTSTPAQYLEKIFQIVLTLPPMEQTGYQRMIDDLVGLRSDANVSVAAAAGGAGSETGPGAAVDQTLALGKQEPAVGVAARAGQIEEAGRESQGRKPIDLSSRIVERVDPLALTPDEYKLINLLGPPLVTGPRSVKRLANSYGLLIATRSSAGGERPDLEPVEDLGGSVALPYRAGMVLLAAVIGFPMLGPEFFPDLYRTAHDHPRLPWRDYLAENRPGTTPEFLHALDRVGSRADLADLPLPRRLSIWADWVIPVGRLSFPTGSAVTRLMTQE